LFIIGCILVLISSFTSKVNFSMSNLWPNSFYSLMIGAVVIIKSVFNLSIFRFYLILKKKEKKDLIYTLLKLHLFMYVLYATISNIVCVFAGINASDVIFQSFPISQMNIYFSYTLALILILHRYQSFVISNINFGKVWEMEIKKIFCCKNFIPGNALLTHYSIVIVNLVIISISFFISDFEIKIGYLQALSGFY